MVDALDQILEEVVEPDPIAAPRAIALAPSNFIFTGEDALRLTVHNSQTGVVVATHYRQHTPEGDIHASRDQFTPSSDRLASTSEFPIGRGALLNVTVFAASGAPRRGQTFVRLQVIRGRGGAAVVLGTIVQGYVTGNQDRAWPGSPLEGSLEGDGYTRAIAGTDPAVGANIAETVPTGARWRLNSLGSDLTTNATVVTRQPYLYFTYAGVGIGLYAVNPGSVGASAVANFAWALGMPLDTPMGVLNKTGGLPNALLLAGSTIQGNASGFQAGDDWAAPILNVTEWLEAA